MSFVITFKTFYCLQNSSEGAVESMWKILDFRALIIFLYRPT